jgi:hypothetical protein
MGHPSIGGGDTSVRTRFCIRAWHQPGCAVPSGLASKPYATRHSRAGLRAVPSLRDSPLNRTLPGTPVPGYGLYRPFGTRL